MSIKKLEEIRDNAKPTGLDFHWDLVDFMNHIIDVLKHQSDQIADLRQKLSKKEDAINISDMIKEARLRNG